MSRDITKHQLNSYVRNSAGDVDDEVPHPSHTELLASLISFPFRASARIRSQGGDKAGELCWAKPSCELGNAKCRAVLITPRS